MQLYSVVYEMDHYIRNRGKIPHPLHIMLRGLQVQAPLLTELFILHQGGIVTEKRHHTVSSINYNIPSRFRIKLNRGIHKNNIAIYMDDL